MSIPVSIPRGGHLDHFITPPTSVSESSVSTRDNTPSFAKDNMNGDGLHVDEGKPLLRELVTHVKYKNAYYYELDNDSFDDALQNTFQPSISGLNLLLWSPADVNDVSIQTAYAAVIDRINTTLSSPQALSLPDGVFSRLQITHDRLIGAMITTTSSPTVTMLKAEITLYREAKYQGKNIGCVCTVDDNNNVSFVQMKVLGVVSADQIQGLSIPGIGTSAL